MPPTPTPPSPCPSGEFVQGSSSQFLASGATLFKAVKTTSWVIKGVTYTAANTSSATAGAGTGPGLCPSTEAGFVLFGHLTAPASMSGKTTELTACLNTDTGTNTSGSFLNDIAAELGGNNSIVIATSTEDGLSSSILFASARNQLHLANRPERSGVKGAILRPRPFHIPTLNPVGAHP